MTIYNGKLWQGRYYEPDNYAGQMWDLQMLTRKAGEDEAGFNNRIDAANKELEKHPKYQNGWYVAIGLNNKQIANTPERWQVIWHPKTYLFLYDPSFSDDKMPHVGVWDASFVWTSNIIVYTTMKGDNLNYRFRQLNSIEVAAVKNGAVVTPPPADDPEDEPDIPDTGSDVVPGHTIIHMICPKCGELIY